MSKPVHAVVMHRFGVSAERVFDACLDPAWVGRWMFGPNVRDERIVELTLEPRAGGKFAFVVERQGKQVHHFGEYLEVERPTRLAFTWITRDAPDDVSRVIMEFSPRAPDACDVKLTHVMGENWSDFVDRAANAWAKMLDALERVMREDAANNPIDDA
jgi:uncharacterized protein YndB with AHSA1/START domain